MGKFDGVLIASDYDNTITYTEDVLRSGGELPPVSEENRQAMEYFMAQGGIFSVATGRALPAFAPLAPTIPMNGPTILFNGAAIYDFAAGRYLYTAFLPEDIRGHVRRLLEDMPGVAMEIYHDDNSIHAINPNEITVNHLHLTHLPTVALDDIDQVPSPISKVLFEEYEPRMSQLIHYIARQSWAADYEVVPSTNLLLELTAHGANKGGMTEQLARLLGISPRHVYCMGDHANDIPMLRFAHIAFAPDNAIAPVKEVPGIRVLSHCRCGAVAAMIDQLDRLY
ncbi:MAG: HAD-IIB family hydrolase [Ruminococcaceae bacterium]|jgi:hypothetical protein|nr:HAD-IIB family hydrolase [Oscillospiraceae bacterium]